MFSMCLVYVYLFFVPYVLLLFCCTQVQQKATMPLANKDIYIYIYIYIYICRTFLDTAHH